MSESPGNQLPQIVSRARCTKMAGSALPGTNYGFRTERWTRESGWNCRFHSSSDNLAIPDSSKDVVKNGRLDNASQIWVGAGGDRNRGGHLLPDGDLRTDMAIHDLCHHPIRVVNHPRSPSLWLHMIRGSNTAGKSHRV